MSYHLHFNVERRILMELFEKVKAYHEEELRKNILEVLNNEKNGISYNFENSYNPDFCVTFFAKNCDLELSKKKQSKMRLAHPELEFLYSRERDLDYYGLKKRLEEERDNAKIGEYYTPTIQTMFFFKNEFDHHVDFERRVAWCNEATKKVKTWTKVIFSKLVILYRTKYNITLALLPLEFNIVTPDKMFISRIPEFDNLVFAQTSKKPIEKIDSTTFIEQQIEIIQNMPGFFSK